MTINDAAKAFGVSRRTIYYWLDRGGLLTLRTPVGHVRIWVDREWFTGPLSTVIYPPDANRT